MIGLSGIPHLPEGRMVDDMVVMEVASDQAFGDVEMSGGSVDVVLAGILGVDLVYKFRGGGCRA